MTLGKDINLAAELESLRQHLAEKSTVPLPERGKDTEATLREILQYLSALANKSLPQGAGFSRSYEITPTNEVTVLGVQDEIEVVQSDGITIIGLAPRVSDVVRSESAAQFSLPEGTENYQVLTWNNDDQEWQVDWVRAHG